MDVGYETRSLKKFYVDSSYGVVVGLLGVYRDVVGNASLTLNFSLLVDHFSVF